MAIEVTTQMVERATEAYQKALLGPFPSAPMRRALEAALEGVDMESPQKGTQDIRSTVEQHRAMSHVSYRDEPVPEPVRLHCTCTCSGFGGGRNALCPIHGVW